MEGVRFKLMLCFLTAVAAAVAAKENDAKIYMVHMDKSQMPTVFSSHEQWYHSIVSSAITTRTVEKQILYVYDNVMHGFSAKLKQSELDALQTMPGHLASYPDTTGKLDTTHSFKFLGLKHKSGIWPLAEFGNRSDVIIGIVDTGIWPESESFRDDGMSEIPARWKGQCQTGTAFNSSLCNRKLIGARYFNKGFLAQSGSVNTSFDYDSARDYVGHGSHTSSTAAGNYVRNVDFFGYAKGTARGMAPRARVAMYKVLWFDGQVSGADVLAAMESAISDGVDVLSLSLHLLLADFYKNVIAIGAFAAVEKGVLVCCSASNFGPSNFTMRNGAPWIFTVGSSTTDRAPVAKVKLGDGQLIQGTSLFVERRVISGVPIIHGIGNESSRTCAANSLDPKMVAGKILLCMNSYTDFSTPISEAKRTGAAAVIIISYDALYPEIYSMPVVSVTSDQAHLIEDYVTSGATNPTADIKFVVTQLGSKPAPAVALTSSRGPDPLSPGIVKPDVIAPGVNILAAWLPYDDVTFVGSVPLEADYALASGTSMASPHVAGVAALVKAIHPDWSPAAIKSALMTTAQTLDNTGHVITNQAYPPFVPATPLDFGAGEVNPNKAADPGLVYDSDVNEYMDYLCALNYTKKEIRVISRREYSCTGQSGVGDLNYPSFLANFTSSAEKVKTFKRIVTNLADDNERPYLYRVIVNAPRGVSVQVEPDSLLFKERNEKLGFSLSMELAVDGSSPVTGECVTFGYLSWVDGRGHSVTSPLVATFC